MEAIKGITSDARFLLKIVILFSTGGTLASKFLNVFLIRATGSITLIVGQSILFATATLLAFLLGTKLLAKINVTTVLRVGIFLILLYYLMILIFQNWISFFLIPLGIVNGLGNGFYWCAVNILLGRLVSDENRGKFFGLQKVFGNLFGIFIPTISGFVIISFANFTGYYMLFSAAVLLLLCTVFLSFKMTGFTSENQLDALPILKVKGNKYWDANKW